MIRVCIHDDAFELGIQNPVACLLRKFEMGPQLSTAFATEADAILGTLPQRSQTILQTPQVMGFEALFGRLGYPRQQPAGHRLIKAVLNRGMHSHNNVVDACNLASIFYGCGLGLHDATEITGNIHVHRAVGTESIRPFGKEAPESIPAGDLVYASTGSVLAWLGRKDVDSEEFKVRDDTRYVLLMALGNEATTTEFNRAACLMVTQLIRKSSPGVYAQFIPTVRATASDTAEAMTG